MITQEDELLRKQIEKLGGPGNWTAIAQALDGRSSKSCRLRWCNQLNPNVKRGPFTADEDDTILAQHAIHGNKWAVISRSMPGRTDNQVKNRFNSTLRRLIASQKKDGSSGVVAPTSPRPRAPSRPQSRLAGERDSGSNASNASSPSRSKRERSSSPGEAMSVDGGQGSPKRSRGKVVDKTTTRSRAADSPRKASSGANDRQGLENLIEASLLELKRLKSIKGEIHEWGAMPYGAARDASTPEPTRSMDEDGVVPSLLAPKPKRGGFSVPVPSDLYDWRAHTPVPTTGIRRTDSLASLGEMISRPASAPLSLQAMSSMQSNGWYARMLDNLGTHKSPPCEDLSLAEINTESFVKPKAMFAPSPTRPTRLLA